jgi:hypothetical protein
MTTTQEANVTPAAPPPEESATTTSVELAYAGPSRVLTSASSAELTLFGNLRREAVRLDAVIKDPLRFREAMSSVYAVVGSDYRYVPKDKTAYLAYLRMRREAAGLTVWQAQQTYFTWMLRNDPNLVLILDPVITVHPDQVAIEVFSKDEGAYARLALDRDALQIEGSPTFGATNIDFSQHLFDSLQQLRSYRPTRLSIGREAGKGAMAGEVLEKKIRVPDSWVRGLLQVQSATTLPTNTFSMAPIDLYNLLRHLRMNGDRKGQRRGLRIELIPGEAPRLVLEPWETVLPCGAGMYRGKAARIVRVWGRRRLMMLRRLLPFVERVDVALLGSGLPSFWILRCGGMTFTLGLTGFTSSNWSQALGFDLLLPRKTQDSKPLESVLAKLAGTWSASAKELQQATGLKGAALVEALQLGCQQGKLMYDLASGVYRLRPLTEKPLDLGRLEFRNVKERIAHDLLVRREAVQIVSENRIAGTGLELVGKVAVTEDKREYRPQMTLGDEGQVSRAECTCAAFRKQGLKAGPCVHLVALRLAYAEQERKRRESGDPRQAIVVQTRTYSRRDDKGEDVFQVSLERQRLKLRWGRAGEVMRLQTLRYNTVDEARVAFFARLDELTAHGYLDATAG